MAFLSIIIVGEIIAWKSSTTTVISQEKSMQAYYLARSGADAISSWIIANPNKAKDLIGKSSSPVHLKSGSIGTVQVSVIKSASGGLTVVSTGTVGNAVETLRLGLVRAQSGFMFSKAIITKSFPNGIAGGVGTGGIEYQGTKTLKIAGGGAINGGIVSNANVQISGGANVVGDVISKGSVEANGGANITGRIVAADGVTTKGGVKISGGIISNSFVDIEGGNISGKIESIGDVSLNWGANVKNSGGIITSGNVTYPQYYNPGTSISTGVSNPFYPSSFPPFPKLTSTPLPATPTGLSDKNDLTLSGGSNFQISQDGSYSSIKLSGGSVLTIDTSNSTLTLFVDNFNVTGGSEIHVKGNGTLVLFVKKFKMNGGTHLKSDSNNNTLIYSNDSNGSIAIGGGAGLNGNVYVYAPASTFNLTGSTQIKGGVVARSVDISGGVSLKPAFMPIPIVGNNSGGYKVGSWSY